MNRGTELEFLFVVEGISLDDAHAVSLLTKEFDAILSWNQGIHRLAVSGSGTDSQDAARNLVARLADALPGLRVCRLDPELVGVVDIARRTGHSRQNVQQWVSGERNASRPFPPPEGAAGRSLAWRWATVNEWLRPLGLDDGATRPSRAEAARIDVMLLDLARAGHTKVPASALRSPDRRASSVAHGSMANVSRPGLLDTGITKRPVPRLCPRTVLIAGD